MINNLEIFSSFALLLLAYIVIVYNTRLLFMDKNQFYLLSFVLIIIAAAFQARIVPAYQYEYMVLSLMLMTFSAMIIRTLTVYLTRLEIQQRLLKIGLQYDNTSTYTHIKTEGLVLAHMGYYLMTLYSIRDRVLLQDVEYLERLAKRGKEFLKKDVTLPVIDKEEGYKDSTKISNNPFANTGSNAYYTTYQLEENVPPHRVEHFQRGELYMFKRK